MQGELKGGDIKNRNSFKPNPSYYNIHTKKKIERLFARGVLSVETLGLNTLCKGCSSHTTLVRLLYPR